MSRIPESILADVETELAYQERKGWRDDKNTPGLFVSYIVNYASRWAMPFTFDVMKYTFYRCMIKVIALAVAAIKCDIGDQPEATTIPQEVSEDVRQGQTD